MKKIVIVGSGGYLKEQYHWLTETLQHDGESFTIKGIISNENFGTVEKHTKIKIIKKEKLSYSKEIYLYLAIGQPKLRKKIIEKFKKFNFLTMKHPSSVVSKGATLGKGITISPGTIIAGDAKIGDFNNFNFGTMLSHDCVVGINNSFSPGAKIMGDCKIGNHNFFGVDSVMIPKTKIKNYNVVGANATVTKNFDSNLTIIGTPAHSTS